MTNQFEMDHLLAAMDRLLDADDVDAVKAEASRLAETKHIKLGDIREGDFVRICWYLPKREASITGTCRVTKVDDQGVHVEPHSGFGGMSFGDGATDLSLMKGIGPMNERRSKKLIQQAWRIVPFVDPAPSDEPPLSPAVEAV